MKHTKKAVNRPKAKKEHSLAWYRKEHKEIPEDKYKVIPRERQLHSAAFRQRHPSAGAYIEKNNYGPLGRPPENKIARFEKYDPEVARLTPKGLSQLSSKKRASYYKRKNIPEADRLPDEYFAKKRASASARRGKPRPGTVPKKNAVRFSRKGVTKRRMSREDQMMEYRRALDSYEDEMAEEFARNVDSRYVNSELEDRGYGDFRKNWKQLGKKNKAKALREQQAQEWRDRNYEY